MLLPVKKRQNTLQPSNNNNNKSQLTDYVCQILSQPRMRARRRIFRREKRSYHRFGRGAARRVRKQTQERHSAREFRLKLRGWLQALSSVRSSVVRTSGRSQQAGGNTGGHWPRSEGAEERHWFTKLRATGHRQRPRRRLPTCNFIFLIYFAVRLWV